MANVGSVRGSSSGRPVNQLCRGQLRGLHLSGSALYRIIAVGQRLKETTSNSGTKTPLFATSNDLSLTLDKNHQIRYILSIPNSR
ncbi:MAG: hypothetical protein H7308_08085 [Chthonomonadaceae bacterium]|nr:hypothetical protein [Chthonomonadaceae bacterium]